VIRTRYISGQFWSEEPIAVGVASHSLSAIPGILRNVGIDTAVLLRAAHLDPPVRIR